MMVLGMCSVVGAEETSGSYGDNNGIITINPAIKGQNYTIYRMLKLESFSGDNYSYKVEEKWETFVENVTNNDNKNYFIVDDVNGYVKWNSEITSDADKAELAKKALAYAQNSANGVDTPSEYKKTADETEIVKYTNLPLGYYLVGSSAGALCSLDTTNPNATIEEKNGVPSVKKEVQEDSKGNSNDAWGNENTADIGQKVEFRVTITARNGAEKYVLHDKMDKGLTFNNDIKVKKNEIDVDESNYTLNTNNTDDCTFEIVFTQKFCNELNANDTIIVTYSATLNKEAVVAGEGNTNTAKLEYGDENFTTPIITKTKTYEIPVFKYTKKGADEKALEGAEFELYRDAECTPTNQIKFIKIETDSTSKYDCYRIAIDSETSPEGKITTSAEGKFKIFGLDADTYYLKEVTAPKGYNKLSAPVKITIGENGTITVNDESITGTDVKVENKTGSLLPSTGGMGTTLFYIFGAILVIGSGGVLITKKRMK